MTAFPSPHDRIAELEIQVSGLKARLLQTELERDSFRNLHATAINHSDTTRDDARKWRAFCALIGGIRGEAKESA